MNVVIEKKVPGFKPSRNGLKFPNYFKDVPLPDAITRMIDTSNTVYGLCGGMCFTVIDHYTAKKPVPSIDEVPGREQPLWDYLFNRQKDSWGKMSSQVLRYTRWMSLADDAAMKESAGSWKELKAVLDANRLAVLGLVYRDLRETLRVWDNHQVLAHGYTIYDEGTVHVNLYDPNLAKDDSVYLELKATRVDDQTAYEAGQFRKGEKYKDVHGFFVVPYDYNEPPDGLGIKKAGRGGG